MKASAINNRDTKWVFIKKGTCSRTLFYILNREFGHPKELEETAADPLAGGIVQNGYQCGMLWGASMGAAAEASRRCETANQAKGLAIYATQKLNASFKARTDTLECEDIVEADLTSKGSSLKLLVSGKFVRCFRIADKWAPEAIATVKDALSLDPVNLPEETTSCASELITKMGGSEEESQLVAGFAGGLGLSGNGCGALAAAVWKNTLSYCREYPGKSTYPNDVASKTVELFLQASDYEFECYKICGRQFKTAGDHGDFIRQGGCGKILDALAASGKK